MPEECRFITFNFSYQSGEFELRDMSGSPPRATNVVLRPVPSIKDRLKQLQPSHVSFRPGVWYAHSTMPVFFFNVHKYFVSSVGTSVIACQE